MIKVNQILRNPLTEYLAWLVVSLKYFIRKDIILEYKGLIINSKIGKYTKLSKNSSLRNSELGDYSYIGTDTKINRAKIGKFCSISSGVTISAGVHPTNLVSTHPAFYSVRKQCGISFTSTQYFEEFGCVEVGNDVWIGLNVVVLDGVRIGNGAIIAANSVVNKDVEPYAIVGGVPAKVIKYRFDPKTIELLEDYKWWDKSESWLHDNQLDMLDIDKFLRIINKKNYVNK